MDNAINPFLLDFSVKDTYKPDIRELWLIPQGETTMLQKGQIPHVPHIFLQSQYQTKP
jgi:hypothetical protein